MGEPEDAFDLVSDRPGHDLRYAIDSSKLRAELGWVPSYNSFDDGIAATIDWYRENRNWWEGHKNAVEEFYRKQGQ